VEAALVTDKYEVYTIAAREVVERSREGAMTVKAVG
jgi:hypothetical protein